MVPISAIACFHRAPYVLSQIATGANPSAARRNARFLQLTGAASRISSPTGRTAISASGGVTRDTPASTAPASSNRKRLLSTLFVQDWAFVSADRFHGPT